MLQEVLELFFVDILNRSKWMTWISILLNEPLLSYFLGI